jgi:hypothetical protein
VDFGVFVSAGGWWLKIICQHLKIIFSQKEPLREYKFTIACALSLSKGE